MQQPHDKKGDDIGIGDVIVSDSGNRFEVLSVDHLQGSGAATVKCLDPVEKGFEQREISRYDLKRYYTIESKAVHEYLPSDPKLVGATIQDLLAKLPADYPQATFSYEPPSYKLMIGNTMIFQGASSSDAIKHTRNYVQEREGHPDLPVGVIYGIYD